MSLMWSIVTIKVLVKTVLFCITSEVARSLAFSNGPAQELLTVILLSATIGISLRVVVHIRDRLLPA